MHVPLTALADDLSGAAEIAALLVGVTGSGALDGRASVVLGGETTHAPVDVIVHDLDTRDGGADPLPSFESVDFVKIDSLLRGRPDFMVRWALDLGLKPVIAPAVPTLGRTTVDGRILIDGRPVEESDLLSLEPNRQGAIANRLSPLTTKSVPLSVVRGPQHELTAALLAFGGIPVVDAEDDDDLDRIATAAGDDERLILLGSGGLAAALGRRHRLARGPLQVDDDVPGEVVQRGTLVVVGSGSKEATEQLKALEASGVPVLLVSHDLLLDESLDVNHPEIVSYQTALLRGPVALTLADRDKPAAHLSRQLATGLGRVAAAAAGSAHLVLTGGETARRTLEQLDVTSLHPVRVLEHGSVLSRLQDGRAVVTRPGSFGRPDNLVRAVEMLARLDLETAVSSTSSRKVSPS